MPMIRLKQGGGPVADLIEAHIQASIADRPETERSRIEGDLRRVNAVYETADKREKRAAESKELTPLGRQGDIKAALKEAGEALKPHRDAAERLKATAAATRAKALQPPAVERSAEAVLIEREVRDVLKADLPMLSAKYLDAIERGDHVIVSAVERSPFPLVDEDTKRRAEKVKLSKSPLKGQLAAEESEAEIFGQVVASVESELVKIAERHGVRPDDPERAYVNPATGERFGTGT